MRKIMVVDDNIDLLLVLQHALKARGYDVTTLSDGGHVLDTLKHSLPDLLILDIHMGKWDGRKICEEVKQIRNYRHIPVILFSATDDFDDPQINCAPDAFIQKPLSTNHFLLKIEELMAAKYAVPENMGKKKPTQITV